MGTTTHPQLSSALFGKTRRAILALLFSHPEESFYLRQIVRLVRTGQGSVQRELQRLTNAQIIQRTVRGRTAFYQANAACPVYEELRGLIVKTAAVTEVLRAALGSIQERIDVAFVFGSAAKGGLRRSSDIDLLVIGAIGFGEVVDALASAQAQIGREVNPTVFGPQEFERRIAHNDHFIATVMDEPKVFVIGGQRELDQLARRGLAD